MLFSEVKGKTKMDMTMTMATPEKADEIRHVIKHHNGNSTWDRLAEYLEEKDSGQAKFVINRTFGAAREVVFAMWSDPAHLAKWLPPTGFTMEFRSAEIRPGGRYSGARAPPPGQRLRSPGNRAPVLANALEYPERVRPTAPATHDRDAARTAAFRWAGVRERQSR